MLPRKPLPEGLNFGGTIHPATNVSLLYDLTWIAPDGRRQSEQHIFDAMLALVGTASRFVLLDMFLYNAWLGAEETSTRRLSDELTAALIQRKREVPALRATVITDPINTAYGGTESEQFDQMKASGIHIVSTNLDALRDSNPLYSLFWRALVQPFGNSSGGLLPNPFGPGRVSIRSYLRMLNFKANHRKTLIADRGEGAVALVGSANPHDGSSAHTNLALQFEGPAVRDLIDTENAVLAFSGKPRLGIKDELLFPESDSGSSIRVLTENAIKLSALNLIGRAEHTDSLCLAMFYLADRELIAAFKAAQARGVALRVILDPNKDAFGHRKPGIPARPVAHELQAAGVAVRWCDTHGEQCHMKTLIANYADGTSTLLTGSANFTRRNLDNFNLETDVELSGPTSESVMAEAQLLFDTMWHNSNGRRITTEYASYADESILKRWLYRFMEGSGISTF